MNKTYHSENAKSKTVQPPLDPLAYRRKASLKMFVFAMSFALMPHAFAEGGLLDMKVGSPDAAGVVTGAAGTGGAQNEAKQLVKCDKPFGKIAVYEPQDAMQRVLMRFSLPSPTGLIRLMI